MKIEFSRLIFEKYSNVKFNENPSGGSRVVPCGQTDRHDEANSLVFAILRTCLKIENSKYEINSLCFTCNHNEFSANKKIHPGTAVAQWLRRCATNRKVTGSIPAGVGGFFIDIKSFRSHHGPGVDSASNRNEYQEHFLGVKAAGA